MDGRNRRHVFGLAVGCLAVLTGLARAQTVRPAGSTRDLEDRAALETQAADAEAQHRTSEAWLLRSRLQKGDFQDGDRIVV